MNYIKHIKAFHHRVAQDTRISHSHLWLYMVLFQEWNDNRFINPVQIYRKEIMFLSKIKSLNTYYKCLKDLHDWGYIIYEPSFNSGKNSMVYLCNFYIADSEKKDNPPRQKLIPDSIKNYIAADIGIYNNKQIQNINIEYGQKQNFKNENFDHENAIKKNAPNSENAKRKKAEPSSEVPITIGIEKRKKIAQKIESNFIPSNFDETLSFFRENKYPDIEAHKFFNHYEANGWKVGGKAPMKNWKAAARNWILNSKNFSKPIIKNTIHVNNDKDYSIPL